MLMVVIMLKLKLSLIHIFSSVIIPSRQVAIEQAIEIACKDDIILILGKGHEKFISLEVGHVDYPGDSTIVKEAIERIYGEND